MKSPGRIRGLLIVLIVFACELIGELITNRGE